MISSVKWGCTGLPHLLAGYKSTQRTTELIVTCVYTAARISKPEARTPALVGPPRTTEAGSEAVGQDTSRVPTLQASRGSPDRTGLHEHRAGDTASWPAV